MISGYYESIRYPSDTGILFRETDHDATYYMVPHWHNGLEIIYILEGEEYFLFTDNRRYHLKCGDFLLVNSQEIHSVQVESTCKELMLQIPYSFVQRHIPDLDCIHFQCIQSSDSRYRASFPEIKETLQALADCYPLQTASDQLLFFSLIYQLLFYLERDCRVELRPEQKSFSLKYMDRLGQITAYTKEHYAEDIRLSQIADLVSLNPDYFTRFFKKHMGMTFLDYLNAIRLDHISKDLLITDLSIQELMIKHGLTNYRLFMKMYRTRFGCTPGAMRKQHRKN